MFELQVHCLPHLDSTSDYELISLGKHCATVYGCGNRPGHIGGALLIEEDGNHAIIGVQVAKKEGVMITAPILTWIHDHLEDDGYNVYEKNDSGDWELWEMKEGDWEEYDWELIEAKSENLSNNVAIPDMEPKGIYIHQHRVSIFILFFVLILFSFDTNGIQ